ncbi:hypothetical protein VNO78_10851 [Psophocarpus tetragonolobus]|uniref:Uncharacterized protein n=1 Tax=Psophocarpus tetragonolobus TaxID=3891 RepID=A0AAN9SLE2_PSOTE
MFGQHGLQAQNSPLSSLFINVEAFQDHPSILEAFPYSFTSLFPFSTLSLHRCLSRSVRAVELDLIIDIKG